MGGILRDIFTMGARPIAAMNSLSLGAPDHPKTRQLLHGIVAGIGGYGNCFGVPTVGGEVRFDKAYNGNCLVNTFAAGLVDKDKIFYSAASGSGMPVVYAGAKTGRDGVGGATMASAEFDDDVDNKRPTVQVGDPFTEKRLMEACLELMETDAIISIQDMGAAGLTCSAVEMGDKGNLGIHLYLEKVPRREDKMSAYEMMLSESQERMLMVLHPEKEHMARTIFEKWDIDFAIIGKTITEDRFCVFQNGEIKANLPLKSLSRNAPEYNRHYKITKSSCSTATSIPDVDPMDALKTLISDPNYASKAWVYEQYDSQVMADTVQTPGKGAGIVRVHGSEKMLAFTSDVTPRYVLANPSEGGKQAVAEAYRNLTAVGALPIALTDNLNFGNPEKPIIMGQFVGAINGISEAAKILNMPVVSGNVSLYNETDGVAILPTPTIAAVGLIKKPEQLINGHASDGQAAIVIGKSNGHIGRTALLECVFKRREGDVPPVTLALEKRTGQFLRQNAKLVNACTDLSDGGLALAAFEMAYTGGVGIQIESEDIVTLFCEDQARYLVACDVDKCDVFRRSAERASIPFLRVGKFTGNSVCFGKSTAALEHLACIYKKCFSKNFD